MKKLEVSRIDFEEERARLSQSYGFTADPCDTVYALMNRQVTWSMQVVNFDQLKMLYFQMALFVYEEGKDPFKLKQASIRSELHNWIQLAERGVFDRNRTRVTVITCRAASCEECQKLGDATFSLHEALERMPIPVRACTYKLDQTNPYGWCRCVYELIFN